MPARPLAPLSPQHYREVHREWLSRLDHTEHTLTLPSGNVLSRLDLGILHMVILGTPRKQIARRCHLSVKAIEKRLQKLGHKLHTANCSCCSLQECLHKLGLASTLLVHEGAFTLREVPTSATG